MSGGLKHISALNKIVFYYYIIAVLNRRKPKAP